MKLSLTVACALLAVCSLPLHAAQRTRMDDHWKFMLGDPKDGASPALDDSGWRTVTLPHDWSIEGRIDPGAPTGGPGGFFPTGIGWYRQQMMAPASWRGKDVEVEFDGVYMGADVYLNGQKLASHPYGYTSFFVNLAPALQTGTLNVLAVRVDNSHQKNSRWYSGSGIYRHVWTVVAEPIHVAPWGVFVSTLKADARGATLAAQTRVLNGTSAAVTGTVQTVIQGPDGKELARNETAIALPANSDEQVTALINVANPPLWSPEQPQLCRAVTRVLVAGASTDETVTPFGARFLAWSPQGGLTINGRAYKLSGGCIHHDNGVLGSCAFDRAEERKIELLKAAGFNAIRTAHNPPSPALLDACDRLGMLVLDEAFDCWVNGKNTQDYHIYFKEWWQRDLDSMVERDRNHPSIIMWSVGNEIPGVYSDMGMEYEPQLVARVHGLDASRPVTNAIFGWPINTDKPGPNDGKIMRTAETVWSALDMPGANYTLDRHIAGHDQHPDRIIVSTESNPPNGKPAGVLNYPFVVGDFVWTAMDYFGESGIGRWFYAGDPTEPLSPPRPGDKPGRINPIGSGSDKLYPWHGAPCGDLDILGNARPAAHYRAILWKMGETLGMGVRQPEDGKHLIVTGWGWYPTSESWTWPGMEGKPIDVEVYSTAPKVRLYLNGKPLGDQGLGDSRTTYHVPYAAGVLKAVGLENGREVGSVTFQTAGPAAAIRLTPDRTGIHADGEDLSFIKVEVVDKEGVVQPNAGQQISFQVTGPATIAGLGNANLKCADPYQGATCHVFNGRALVVLRSTDTPGAVTLTARATGLSSATASLQTQGGSKE